jgi:hypothetical protein
MFWAVKQLLVPINYLRIRHGDSWFRSKKVYDFVFPIILTALTCGVFWWIGISLRVFDHDELIKRVSDLLALMIVFYMAALAAVATFDREGIDTPLKGGDALLKARHHETGADFDRVLTYRQFISYLFGYLSFLSLVLYVFILVFAVGWAKFEMYFTGKFHAFLECVVDPIIFAITFFAIWQLVITSLLGIYFLTERIQSLYEESH